MVIRMMRMVMMTMPMTMMIERGFCLLVCLLVYFQRSAGELCESRTNALTYLLTRTRAAALVNARVLYGRTHLQFFSINY